METHPCNYHENLYFRQHISRRQQRRRQRQHQKQTVESDGVDDNNNEPNECVLIDIYARISPERRVATRELKFSTNLYVSNTIHMFQLIPTSMTYITEEGISKKNLQSKIKVRKMEIKRTNRL